MIDRLFIGAAFRAVRIEQRLRQVDVARRAMVSRQTVSRLERGRFEGISVEAYLAIADALDAEVGLVPRQRGSRLPRLKDWKHAALQTAVAEGLVAAGWTVLTEQSFNHFGERGSVDVLGWHPERRALAVIEVKPDLRDLQETERILDMKGRVVPTVVRKERGWRPENVGVILAVTDTTRNRKIVAEHAAMVDACLPGRTVDIRRWLEKPEGAIRGVSFSRNARHADTTQKPRGVDRVRLTEEEARRVGRRRR